MRAPGVQAPRRHPAKRRVRIWLAVTAEELKALRTVARTEMPWGRNNQVGAVLLRKYSLSQILERARQMEQAAAS